MQNTSFTAGYEELTLQDRLMRIFYAPKSSYEAIRENPTTNDWMVPVLLMCLVGIGANYMTLSVTSDPGLPAMQDELRKLSEENMDKVIENLENYREHGWIGQPLVNSFSTVVLVGLVLFGLGRWVFRADVSLRQMLLLKAYANVIAVVEIIVRTPLMLINQQPMVRLGPGAFVGDEMAKSFFGKLLIGANIFDIWQAIVIGIGLGVMVQVPPKRTIATVLVLWGIWIMMGAITPESPPVPNDVGVTTTE